MPRAGGRRSAGRLPRRRSGPPGHGRRSPASSPSTRSSPPPARGPTSCWQPRRTARRRARPPTSRVGSRRCRRRSRPRGTSRPDWMIAAELARLLGTDFGYASVDDVTAAIAADGAGVRRRVARRAAHLARRRRSRPPRRRSIRSNCRSRRCPIATATTSGWWSAASCTTRPSVRPTARRCRSCRSASPLTCTRSTSSAPASSPAPRSRCPAPAPASCVALQSPTRPCARGTVWVPFNQPGGTVGELIDCHAAVTDVRIENL